jgi:hypothetical protein
MSPTVCDLGLGFVCVLGLRVRVRSGTTGSCALWDYGFISDLGLRVHIQSVVSYMLSMVEFGSFNAERAILPCVTQVPH